MAQHPFPHSCALSLSFQVKFLSYYLRNTWRTNTYEILPFNSFIGPICSRRRSLHWLCEYSPVWRSWAQLGSRWWHIEHHWQHTNHYWRVRIFLLFSKKVFIKFHPYLTLSLTAHRTLPISTFLFLFFFLEERSYFHHARNFSFFLLTRPLMMAYWTLFTNLHLKGVKWVC